VAATRLSDVLDDPHWIPAALDGDAIVLARVDPARVRRLAFLDGREAFADETRRVPLAEFLAAATAWDAAPAPTILHVSFCGSTLLARLLDVAGRTIVYREPAIQIALADAQARGALDPAVLAAVTAALARSVAGARAITKPSSWANALMPHWTATRAIRPVFVTMAPRAFLRAVFRGGRERIAYTLRLAALLAPLADAEGGVLKRATAPDPLDTAARIALAALQFQTTLMRDARRTLDADLASVTTSETLLATPDVAARRCASVLGIPDLTPPTPPPTHAKASDRPYSIDRERAADAEVERHHAVRLDAALGWGEANGFDFAI
jgi:hypothetical protein